MKTTTVRRPVDTAASSQLADRLYDQIGIDVRKRIHRELQTVIQQEILETETLMGDLEAEIQRMLDDSTVELSRVMQRRTRLVELQGYLKGLNFKAALAKDLEA